jgi:hypothetical protein
VVQSICHLADLAGFCLLGFWQCQSQDTICKYRLDLVSFNRVLRSENLQANPKKWLLIVRLGEIDGVFLWFEIFTQIARQILKT